MKIWITKYALTTGIIEVDAEISQENGMVRYKREGEIFVQYAHGKQWHYTKESAIKTAEEMREKRIRALGEQIKKISALKF